MNSSIHLHDSVALLENTRTTDYRTGGPRVVRQGQIGTVVMRYKEGDVEVGFTGRDGRAYAVVLIAADKLMIVENYEFTGH